MGGVANDKVFNTVELFFGGLIDKTEAINRIPNDLPGKIPLAAENDISLYWEIDYLTQYHGYHISAKIRQTTMFCVIAQNVPFEGYSQHGHFDSRPAKIHLGHICKSSRQELQQYILKNRNEGTEQ